MHFIHLVDLLILIVVKSRAQHVQLSGIIFGKVSDKAMSEIFVTTYHETLWDCQENCINRPKCVALDFHTVNPHECLLNSVAVASDSLVSRFGWVHQARSDLTIETPCNNCNDDQTCDTGTNTCVYRECNVVKSGDDFLRLGNGNTVGSRSVLACPPGKFPESPGEIGTWPVTGVCRDTGNWTHQSLICSDDPALCHDYLVGPETRTNTAHWTNYVMRDVTLVSGDCGVPDDKMTASSSFNDAYFAHWAKFDHEDDTWVPSGQDSSPYLQVEFGRVLEVKRVSIRGRTTNISQQYVTLFNITYSTTCTENTFPFFVENATGGETFIGNTDSETNVEHTFVTPINARCLRFNVITYVNTLNLNHFGMKLEYFGTVKLPVL